MVRAKLKFNLFQAILQVKNQETVLLTFGQALLLFSNHDNLAGFHTISRWLHALFNFRPNWKIHIKNTKTFL